MARLHSELKLQTRDQHQQLERNVLIAQLLSPSLDMATYQTIIITCKIGSPSITYRNTNKPVEMIYYDYTHRFDY